MSDQKEMLRLDDFPVPFAGHPVQVIPSQTPIPNTLGICDFTPPIILEKGSIGEEVAYQPEHKRN